MYRMKLSTIFVSCLLYLACAGPAFAWGPPRKPSTEQVITTVAPTVVELDTTTVLPSTPSKPSRIQPYRHPKTKPVEQLTTTVAPTVVVLDTTTVLPSTRNPPYLRPKTKPVEQLTTTVAPTVVVLDTTTVLPSTRSRSKPYHRVPRWMRPKTNKPEEQLTTIASPSVVALETTSIVPKLETESLTSAKPILIETTPLVKETKRPESTPILMETTPLVKEPPRPEITSMEPLVQSSVKETLQPEITSMEPLVTEPLVTEPLVTEPLVESSVKPLVTETPVMPKRTKMPKPSELPRIDFDCRRKDDGYYADPKDKCSPIYYACVGGLGRKMECAGGIDSKLVYEPDTGMCERRQESFRCTGTRKTTLPSTPLTPPPPTPPKSLLDCSKLDDGWYPDPSKKCSHVFFSCSNGLGSQFDCPGNMYFDLPSQLCLAYQDVEACIGRKPVTKKPIKTTPAAPKEKLPIDCSIKESGSYPDPAKKCSAIYYVCSNGDGFKRECPSGTYFDKKKQLCDYFDDVWECSYRTKGPSTVPVTTNKPAPSIASLPSTEFNCTGKDDGSYLSESKKCSSHYYRCVGGIAYKANCPRGLYYDKKNDLCDRWANLYECSGVYPTSPKPTESTKAPVIEKLPVDCTKYPDGDFPDPEKKCSSIYYSCSGQIGKRRQCPLSTYYDNDFGICDIKDNVPACSGKPKPVTPKPTPRRPIIVTKSPYDCVKRKDGNYPFGKCHSKYWSCVGGSSILSVCPANTYYDTELDECGHKEEIPACGGSRPKPSVMPEEK